MNIIDIFVKNNKFTNSQIPHTLWGYQNCVTLLIVQTVLKQNFMFESVYKKT